MNNDQTPASEAVGAIQATNEKLELALERMERNRDMWRNQCAAQSASLSAKQAEVERLRSALNAMLTHMGMDEDEWNRPTFDQARSALKGST